MPTASLPIKDVPTNIITGFLGVGKTTAILHLLKSKPEHQRWAVLVNEFGEIGIDASLIEGQSAQTSKQAGGLFITQVPGGCMCCASGVPMQIALNALLTKAKPDRLLIEPTGLGHPKEVLKVLRAKHYQDVLQLNATVTLVDARHISDERYTNHDTFNQQ
ncbi:MAG: GTP-binding protein, partial [Algicola sp.]|nr:GTP-binding protein [Algicola sp.]